MDEIRLCWRCATALFMYWVPSNLKIKYAPLLPENNVLSVKNMDGSELDPRKTYKAAPWSGSLSSLFKPAYFDAATLAAMEAVTAASNKTSREERYRLRTMGLTIRWGFAVPSGE